MNPEFDLARAFLTGILGAFHCLGMCSGIVAGFFVHAGYRRPTPYLLYHATRIAMYVLLGVLGAVLGRVLVQSGIVGKGQGILMMGAGLLVIAIGLGMLGLWSRGRHGETPGGPASQTVAFDPRPRSWRLLLGGLLNGLVPCSLVFSVALQAAVSADPLRASGLMLAFGLGTLPAMASAGLVAAFLGANGQQLVRRLAGSAVIALGGWTFYEGLLFFDIMRGLANW